jgi:hypothetical protein
MIMTIPYLCFLRLTNMNRIVLAAFFAIFLSLSSCKEDFEIAAPYKNITIVYAMLDKDSSVNYIRIQKAFMSADKSALDMAKVADSSFYADGVLDVKMHEIDANGNVIDIATLSRVNMNDLGRPKEPGTFFTSPNYAYQYNKTLSKFNTYRLVIKNNQTGDIDSSTTSIIPNDTTQGNFYVLAFGDNNYPPENLAFRNTTAVGHQYKLQVKVGYPAAMVEGIIRFGYWEVDNVNPPQHKVVDFNFATTSLKADGSGTLQIPNSAFYSFFRNALGTAPANTLRYLDSTCVIDVYAGSKEFVEYQTITQAQMSGITSTEIKPIYTNMKGTDVYGLFTTKALRRGRAIPIDKVTVDSLAKNPQTNPTGLQDKFYGEP